MLKYIMIYILLVSTAWAQPVAFIELEGGGLVLTDDKVACTEVGWHDAVYLYIADHSKALYVCWFQEGGEVFVKLLDGRGVARYDAALFHRLPKLIKAEG